MTQLKLSPLEDAASIVGEEGGGEEKGGGGVERPRMTHFSRAKTHQNPAMWRQNAGLKLGHVKFLR
jgi:hypothetical protein